MGGSSEFALAGFTLGAPFEPGAAAFAPSGSVLAGAAIWFGNVVC
jgi:hypothetical protein